METISFKTQTFEGPLDLLLHLISKRKLSICDVSLAEISKQYFEYITKMQEDNIELSSEFLVTAAQLLYIKSKELLPRHEEEEEEETQEDLTKRLKEYKKYKETAEEIKKLQFLGDKYFDKGPEKLSLDLNVENLQIPLSKLVSAFYDVLNKTERRKPARQENFKGIVGREKVSIRKMSNRILDVLNLKKKVKFIDVFSNLEKPYIIASFLAVLELVKLSKIDLYEDCGEIFIKSTKNTYIDDNIKFEFE